MVWRFLNYRLVHCCDLILVFPECLADLGSFRLTSLVHDRLIIYTARARL